MRKEMPFFEGFENRVENQLLEPLVKFSLD